MLVFKKERLENLRALEGMSQREFAKKAGVNRVSIIQWENGETDPNLSSLLKICNTYRTPIGYFFADTDVCKHNASKGRG